MKNAFSKWFNYVIAIVLFAVAFLAGLLPAYAIKYSWFSVSTGDTTWNPEYPTLFGAALFLLIGFVWQDLYKANYRRKVKNWDGTLSQDVKDKAWMRCTALFVAAGLCLVCALIYLAICAINGVATIYTLL